MRTPSSGRSLALLAQCLLGLLPAAATAVEGNLVLSSVKITDTSLGGALITGAQFGLDATGVGFANADSFEDIAVGARLDDSGGTDQGSFWLIFLDANGAAVTPPTRRFAEGVNDAGHLSILESGGGSNLSSFFGDGLAVLPDLDNDGLVEVKLAVGASGADPGTAPEDSGAIYLVDINKANWMISGVVTIASNQGGFATLDAEDRFGQRVTSLGDWDNDGMPELGVGAFGDDDGGFEGNGAYYVLYMKPDGTGVKTYMKLSATQGGFDGVLDGTTSSFGTKGAAVGDLNGDEQVDLVVGASNDGPAGSAYVIFMHPACATDTTIVPHPTCVAKPGSVRLRQGEGGFVGPLASGANFGISVSFLPDPGGATGRVAVGAHLVSSSTGELWLLRLHGNGAVASEERIASGVNGLPTLPAPPANVNFGITSNPFDLAGDGIQDLIVSAWMDDTGGTNTGAVYLLELDGCTTVVTHPVVFHSPGNDGVNPCVPIALTGSSTPTLHIYLETGTALSSVPANVCQTATASGDELCAWDVRVAVDPPMYIASFDPDVQIETSIRTNGPPWGPPGEPDTLRISWIGSSPTVPADGPIKIGDLTIGGLGAGGNVKVAPGSVAVGAARQLLPIATKTIGLPEPEAAAGLLAGGALLAWLARCRARRGALRRRGAARLAALLCALPSSALLLSAAPPADAAISVKGQKRILDPQGDDIVSGANAWARSPIALGDLGAASSQGDGSHDLVIGDVERGAIGWLNPTFLDQNENRLGYEYFSSNTDTWFGHAIANLGDIDGDGHIDLLVGAPEHGGSTGEPPSDVYILELAADGTELSGSRTTLLSDDTDFNSLGMGVAALGDIDGDGLIELAVGNPNPFAQGVELVSINPTTRAVVSSFRIDSGELPIGSGKFGFAVTGIGDIDDDGVRDLAVGAPGTNDRNGSCTHTTGTQPPGAVWIVRLQVNGPSSFGVKAYQKISETSGGLGLCLPDQPSALANEYWAFGGALASHGDALDVAGGVLYVGVADDGSHPQADRGFYALALRPNGTVRKAYKVSHSAGVGFVNGNLANNKFGGSLGALPDMNGDETLDLAVGDVHSTTFTAGDPTKAESVYILYLQDTDHDGLDDNLDNCVDHHNPLQEDQDNDGDGDLCDNCVDVANANQADADDPDGPGGPLPGDGEGDVCEPVELQLITTGTPAAPSWDLKLQCGAYSVTDLAGAIVLPSGILGTPPLTLTGTSIGSSSVSGPGLVTPAGVRGDAIYFQISGNGAPDGRLCTALDPPVPLGTLACTPLPSACPIAGTQLAAAALSLEGVGTPGFGLAAAETAGGPVPVLDTRLVNGPPLPILDLELGPAVIANSCQGGSNDGLPCTTGTNCPGGACVAGTRWEVCVPRASEEFHRVAFGLIAPQGTTTGQMRWLGCDGAPPNGSGQRSCAAGPGFAPGVNPLQSWTAGPSASPPGTLLPHTLYVVLEGARFSSGLLPTLNFPGQAVCLGTVELDTSGGLEPALTTDGVNDLDDYFAPGNPIVPFEQVLFGAADPTQVKLIGHFDPADDLDADGIQDLGDLCPFAYDPAQLNRGSFLDETDESDAFGDACQCAEATDDGAVLDPADFDELWGFLAGNLTNPTGIEARCSVAGTTECNIRDLVFLKQALDTAAPAVDTRCDAALSPAPGP